MSKPSFFQAIICALLLFSVCPISSLALPPDGFFPSQVGNLWQYQYDVGTPYSWRITRDSVDAGSSRFLFGVINNSVEFLRYKVDTMGNVHQNPPSWIRHDYRLDADTGEAWVWYSDGEVNYYAWLYATTSYPVFGITKTVKIFRFALLHPDSGGNEYYYTEQHLASDFGLVFETGEPGYALFLWGCVISGDTFGVVVSAPEEPANLPQEVILHQNYPNPFNPATTIEYEVAERGIVRLRVLDLLGRQVGVLAEGIHGTGKYAVRFDGSSLSSGVYLIRIETQRGILTKRMMLLK